MGKTSRFNHQPNNNFFPIKTSWLSIILSNFLANFLVFVWSQTLSFREELVNHYLMVQKELAVEASRLTKQPYLASRHFFQVKEEIEKTSIFDIMRMMPKGRYA